MDGKVSLVAVVILVNVTVLCLAVQPKYKDCGSVKGSVKSVNISAPCDEKVCKLKKGQNVIFEVKFAPNEIVTSSKAEVEGVIAGIKVPFPLPNSDGCNGSGLTCPLKAGQNVMYRSTIFVKTIFPDVKLVVEWFLKDQAGENIWCVAIPVEIVS